MKKICPVCEGSGQLSSFRGVSRFLLSWEECPECGGLGCILAGQTNDYAEKGNANRPANDKTAGTPRGDRKNHVE